MIDLDSKNLFICALLAGVLVFASCGGDEEETLSDDLKDKAKPAKFQQGATQVISITGKVTVFDRGRSSSTTPSNTIGRKVQVNESIGSGSRITTGQNSEVTLLFSSGSFATLGPNSDLLIDAFEQQAFQGSDKKIEALTEEVSSSRIKLELELGELILKVKKLKKHSSLDVSTSLGIAGVRGTEFKVDLDNEEVGVSVLSGAVEFIDNENFTVSIDKETRFMAARGAPPREIALTAAARSRIETVNRAAGKQINRITLNDLTKAYQELNQMRSRYDPKKRLARLLAGGGKESTDVAVTRGLDWLKARQAPDGSWGANAKMNKVSSRQRTRTP